MRYLFKEVEFTEEEWKEECKYYDVEIEYKSTDYYNYIGDLDYFYLRDLIDQLKIITENMELIAIADIGRWNGRVLGYKELSTIEEAFTYYDSVEIYIERGDLKIRGLHHDGVNYITIRAFKDIPDQKKENFLDKIYCNNLKKGDISRYTRSLKKELYKNWNF